MSDGVGDYYRRKDQEARAAHAVLVEARQRYADDPSGANLDALRKAERAHEAAADTGD